MLLLVATSILLATLGFINVRIGRSAIYPAAIFCFVWTALLAVLALAGDRYYALHPQTLLMLAIGATTLSIGAAITSRAAPQITYASSADRSDADHKRVRQLLDVCLIVVIALLPFYIRHVLALAAQTGIDDVLIGARVQMIAIADNAGTFMSIINNVIYLAVFVSLAIILEDDGTRGRRIRSIVAVTSTLIYSTITGSQGGLVSFLSACTVLVFLKHGRVLWRYLVYYVAGILSVMAVAGFYLKEGDFNNQNSVMQNLASVWDLIIMHLVGGTVALDRVISGNEEIPSPWTIWRPFAEVAQRFGFDMHLPYYHADYATIAHDRAINVYTMYFIYYADFGWLGVILIPFLVGAAVSLLFVAARARIAPAMLLYSMAAASLVLSVFSEFFFLGVNYWMKAAVFFSMLYIVGHATRRREVVAIQA